MSCLLAILSVTGVGPYHLVFSHARLLFLPHPPHPRRRVSMYLTMSDNCCCCRVRNWSESPPDQKKYRDDWGKCWL